MMTLSTWRPPYDFKNARPTFIDAWPQPWLALAPAQELVILSRDEMNALGWQIAGFGHWFSRGPAAPLMDLAYRLDAAVERLGRSTFIRLTSRSPKDSLYAQRKGLCVADGGQALALIVEGSERCAADLRMALDYGIEMAIVVRKWIDFRTSNEFRCFMVDREFAGASQFASTEAYRTSWAREQTEPVVRALSVTMNRIVATSHVGKAAFDIVCLPFAVGRNAGVHATLLDVNPLTKVTDFGLFSFALDFDRTVRFRSVEAHTCVSLPRTSSTDERDVIHANNQRPNNRINADLRRDAAPSGYAER